MELDRALAAAARGAGMDDDLLDQPTQGLPRSRTVVGRQACIERLDRAQIMLLVIGREADHRSGGCRGQAGGEGLLFHFQRLQALDQGTRRILLVLKATDEPGDTLARLAELDLDPVAVGVGRLLRLDQFPLKRDCEARDEGGGQESSADPGEDPVLQLPGRDRAIAALAMTMPLAAPATTASRKEGAATGAALDQPGEDVGRAFGTAKRVGGDLEMRVAGPACLLLLCLHLVPQILVDDPQVGLVAHDPFGLGVEPGLAAETAAFGRHLDPGSLVEDATPDIEFVVEDTFAKLDAAGQCGGIPQARVVAAALASTRGGDAFPVQDVADLLEAGAARIEFEDATDEGCFFRDDHQPVAVALRLFAGIAQRLAAGRAAALGSALQAPPRGVGDASALLLAHQRLEGHDQIVDRADGDGMHLDPVEAEQLDHIMEMLGVAAEPVDILDDEDLGVAAVEGGEHGLQARPLHRGAGDVIVAIPGDHVEAVALCVRTRECFLVGDRGGLLLRIVEALAAVTDRLDPIHLFPRHGPCARS